MSIAHDCLRLPTPDEKFPDLEDLSVGAFIKGTGALPTFGRESIIKSHFGKSENLFGYNRPTLISFHPYHPVQLVTHVDMVAHFTLITMVTLVTLSLWLPNHFCRTVCTIVSRSIYVS